MRPEELPIELWIEFFQYLPVNDIYRAFTNLNKYFTNILVSHHLSFELELKADGNANIEHLPTLFLSDANLHRIICLKSSVTYSYDHFPEFYHNHGTKLIRLQSLIIKVNTQEIPSICLALHQLNTLRYLSLTCIPNQNLLESILASRSLRNCKLHFWRITTPIDYHLGIDSLIQILSIQLQDDSNHSVMKLLLSHMPNLTKLEIIKENFINNNSHPLFNQELFQFSNVKILKLTWDHKNIQSDCLQHLVTMMPGLKHLYLNISYYKLNETLFDNLIHRLWMILNKMNPIKVSILCRRLTKTTENNFENIFNNYCQQILYTINSRLNACFEVKWSQENLKLHKIEIILKSFYSCQ